MKLFMLFAAAALIVGGIYHTEVSQYFTDLSVASSRSGGASAVMDSIQGASNSGKALMGGVGNALNR